MTCICKYSTNYICWKWIIKTKLTAQRLADVEYKSLCIIQNTLHVHFKCTSNKLSSIWLERWYFNEYIFGYFLMCLFFSIKRFAMNPCWSCYPINAIAINLIYETMVSRIPINAIIYHYLIWLRAQQSNNNKKRKEKK